MGIGDWGLGIGDWGLDPIPNPQSPIPISIFTPILNIIIIIKNFYFRRIIKNNYKIKKCLQAS